MGFSPQKADARPVGPRRTAPPSVAAHLIRAVAFVRYAPQMDRPRACLGVDRDMAEKASATDALEPAAGRPMNAALWEPAALELPATARVAGAAIDMVMAAIVVCKERRGVTVGARFARPDSERRPEDARGVKGTEKGVGNTMSDVVAWGLGSAWLALMGENSDENRRATDQIVQSLTARVNQTVEPSLSTCDELVSNIIQIWFMNLRFLMPYIRNSSEFSEFSVDPNRIDHNHHLSPGNTGFMCYEVQCAIV